MKQLKEILMLNRVDFKGCCEKTELLERVQRLWNELHSVPGKSNKIESVESFEVLSFTQKNTLFPAIDKLPSDDLCKICMDAPIECVILECGHMATCTGCGKVRPYIFTIEFNFQILNFFLVIFLGAQRMSHLSTIYS